MLIRSKFSLLREYLTPINHASNFSTTGEISPEEFVKAGDYLVYKFPTWEWSTAPEKLQKDFLPKDKQYLVTKHVPSPQRAFNYLGIDTELDEDEEELEDGWVKSHKIHSKVHQVSTNLPKRSDAIHDIDDDELNDLVDDAAELEIDDFEDLSQHQSHVRKYDLYICYSTSYRVPKLYLVGFNANGIPLLPNQMFDDISSDYRDKTATIENLPVSYNTTSVSIHPCRHSSVMKVFMKHAADAQRRKLLHDNPGESTDDDTDTVPQDGIRVDQYLIIFLKFIASVTPGIEYDYTMEVF